MKLDTLTCLSNVLLWLATYTNWFLILPLDVTSILILIPFDVLWQ